MTLFNEILRLFSSEAGVSIQYTVIDGQGGYFQNVKRMTGFSDTQIIFCGKKGGVCVEGVDLALGKYCGGDALIYGKIKKVEQIRGGGN